jgi:HK97 gp10 family phage protein
MAKVTIAFSDDVVKKLAKLGTKTDEILEKTLRAGADVVKPVFKANLAGSIGRNTKRRSKSTGELADSLGISPVKSADDGSVDIKIGFAEPRKDGKRNAMIASILEHGRSGQPARPFISATKNAVKGPATEAMVAAFNKEVDGL